MRMGYSKNHDKERIKVCRNNPLLITGFSCRKYQTYIIKTERSDTIILGILAHFRHFPVYPSWGITIMTIGIICCKVLEKEIRQMVRDIPEVCHLEVMDWGLHTQPDLLSKTLCHRIEELQNKVQAIVLGYGQIGRAHV